jgi:DNA primase
MSDTVQQIKERLSIVDVVSPYVKLTKAGKYWKGLSPFNKEKTPSFYVSPDRGLYHCFSSGKGGDMFTFVEEMERVDFKGALKILAEKAGVAISYEAPGARDRKEELYAAMEAARAYFVNELGSRADAREYLVGRSITAATIEEWSLGYAPKSWQSLHEALSKKGISDGILDEAGLIKQAEASSGERLESSESDPKRQTLNPRRYDRFRGRIMFPIRDASGRTIAFTGRIFEDDPEHPQAKYLNSPETPLFEKSKILYGIDVAKGGIRSLNFAILVEGQFDLLMAHQAGYVNTLALSGTAFTEDHAKLIQRHTENLVIAFDGDRAGVAAAGRAASIALSAGLNVKVAAMPPGEDPADLIKRDVSIWKHSVREATHVIDFYLAYIRDSGYDQRRMRLEASRTVLPYLAAVRNEIDRAHFVQRVAEAIGIPEDAVRGELKKVNRAQSTADSPAYAFEPFLSRGGSLERLLAGIKAALGDEGLLSSLSPEDSRAALIEGDVFLERYPDQAGRDLAIGELESDFTKELSREKYRETVLRLKSAEKAGDSATVDSLMHALATLAKTL